MRDDCITWTGALTRNRNGSRDIRNGSGDISPDGRLWPDALYLTYRQCGDETIWHVWDSSQGNEPIRNDECGSTALEALNKA